MRLSCICASSMRDLHQRRSSAVPLLYVCVLATPPPIHARAHTHPDAPPCLRQVGMAPFLLLEGGTLAAYGWGWLDGWNILDFSTYAVQVR